MKHFNTLIIRRLLQRVTVPTAVYFFMLAVVMIPNIALSYTEQLTPAGRLANILLPLGVYYVLTTLTRRLPLTVVLMFPVMFFAAFQLVLLDLYGRSVIAVDMFINVATTNAGEATELLANLKGVIILVIILYLPPLVWAIWCMFKGGETGMLPRGWMRPNRIAAACCLAGGIAVTAAAMTSREYRLTRDLYPLNIANNLRIAIARESQLHRYDEMSRDFRYQATATHPEQLREIYIMVIGETSRAANWQLAGYNRSTNPRLSRRHQSLSFFDHVMSESNTTHKSVPMLMTPLNAEQFDSLYHSRGILSAFREAGFRTAFFSNQKRNHSFIDFFGEEADTCLFIKESPRFTASGEPHDIALTECVSEAIARGDQKLFIVLHSYGSHFKYADRYPASCRRFKPDDAPNASAPNRPTLVNAYDNSILATDMFLERLMAILDTVTDAATALIYTADHGEDIFDDSRHLFLHASPCPSIYQLHVPLIVYTGPLYRRMFPTEVANLQRNLHKQVSSTEVFFHTMLDLAGLATPRLDLRRSLASIHYAPVPRRYINDHNESVDLSHAGFMPEDYSVMAEYGLTVENDRKESLTAKH